MAGDSEKLDKALSVHATSIGQVSNKPDDRTQLELKAAQLARYQTGTDRLRLDNKGRKKYARLTFRLIAWWLSGMFLIVFLQGFLHAPGSEFILWDGSVFKVTFELSDKVLLMLLGSSTVTIIGLFATVMTYLFHTKSDTPEAEGAAEVEETEADTAGEEEAPVAEPKV